MRALRAIGRALVPRSLHAQMILAVGLLVLVQIGISGIIAGGLIGKILQEQIGRHALVVAETLARNPIVIDGVLHGDPDGRVQELAEEVRGVADGEFVVVCDSTGVRLSHPDAWKIGEHFVGGDEGPALTEGRSYVSAATGTLGPSLRGFAPVRAGDGRVVGFVSVGYLVEDIDGVIRRQRLEPRVFVFLMALVGLLCAVFIADRFKRAILGLEPREIASLFQEREAILETIRESVLLIDPAGTVRLANAAARRDLEIEPGDELVGRPVDEIVPPAIRAEVLEQGEPALDREVSRRGTGFVVNVLPVRHGQRIVGAVASFRRRDELDHLARELARTREYADLLRAQAHEHSNQLHTIAGLIQIGAASEALQLILDESADYQELVSLLRAAVPHPLLSGLIIGKGNRASELKVQLIVDPDSSLRDVPPGLPQEKLVTVLGNLLDNAFEAAVAGGRTPRAVRLSMTDLGHDLILEIEDSGRGIAPDEVENLFRRGVTTKKTPGHGVGLHLVREALTDLGGQITVGESDLGGALLTVIVPKWKGGAE